MKVSRRRGKPWRGKAEHPRRDAPRSTLLAEAEASCALDDETRRCGECGLRGHHRYRCSRFKFVKRVYSGTCLCGHSHEDHHGGMVMNPKYYDETGEWRSPGECEYFGCNEWGGLDPKGDPHCGDYVDRDDPDPSRRAEWDGTSLPRKRTRKGRKP